MRSRLIRIGNSRGLRLAKPLLEQAGLTDEVEIQVERGALVIRAVNPPRAGWADAVRRHGAPPLLDPPLATRFDDEEWNW